MLVLIKILFPELISINTLPASVPSEVIVTRMMVCHAFWMLFRTLRSASVAIDHSPNTMVKNINTRFLSDIVDLCSTDLLVNIIFPL